MSGHDLYEIFYLHNRNSKNHSMNICVKQMKLMPPQNDFISFFTISFFLPSSKNKRFFSHAYICICNFSFLSVSVLYLAAVGTFSPPHKLVFISSSKCIYRCVCLFSMKNRLKLLQRISFLIFAIRSNFYCTTNTTKMQKNKIVEDE